MAIFPQSDEFRLLLLCVGRTADPTIRAEINRLTASPLDWKCVLRESKRHYVAFLLLSTLGELNALVPGDLLDDLKRISMKTAANNLRFRHELIKVVGALERVGVELMLLKGAALVQVLNVGLSSRPMGDIDVLVREKDFQAFRATLYELGYRLPYELPCLTDRELPRYAHFFDQIKFRGSNGIKIDTHFRLLNMGMPSVDEESVWERAVKAPMGDVSVFVPSPEDMLLHLCFHSNHHLFCRIYFFSDVARILERYAGELDWQYLSRVVERRRMKASVYHALLLTKELLGTPIPPDVLDRFRPTYIRRKLFECTWQRGLIGHARDSGFGSFEGPIYYVLEMDGFSDKLNFIFRSLFPPQEWLSSRFSLPRSKRLYARYLRELTTKSLRAKG